MTPFKQPQQSGSPKSECGRVVSMGPSNPDPLQTGQSRGPVNGATSPYPYAQPVKLPSPRGIPRHRGGGGNGRNFGSSSTRLISPWPPGQSVQGRVQATTPYI